jgi:hypothetical protein
MFQVNMMDGINYRSWAFRIKMLLRAHGLWEITDDAIDTDEKVDAVSSKEWSDEDQRVLEQK